MNKKEIGRLIEDCSNRYSLSEMPAILDGLKDAGFHYATRAGHHRIRLRRNGAAEQARAACCC